MIQKLLQTSTVSIDTRTIERGQIFFAIKGDRVDGHDFLDDAIKKGACALVINVSAKDRLPKLCFDQNNVSIICVPDTVRALVETAREWRGRFDCPIVGITGSIGKTTTKEMVHSILRQTDLSHHVSYKNQNSLIGLCLNIVNMRLGCQVAVFELGISLRDEMEKKASILRPTIGIITTVAHSHMAGLGGLEEIACEKRKIFTFFGSTDTGIICGDQKLLSDVSYAHPVISFGLKKKDNNVRASSIRTYSEEESFGVCFSLHISSEEVLVRLQTNHRGQVHNALAASSVASLLGIDLQKIVDGLQEYAGCEGRFESRKLRKNRGWLINDCYNANPESMRAALLAFHELPAEKKIAVLGDMLELGEREVFLHQQVGQVLSQTTSISQVILVGDRARHIAQTAPKLLDIVYVNDWKQATTMLEKMLVEHPVRVLVKASHAIGLGNLVRQVCE
ncbi:UDP-N-acetylmuramoyl-tripeptide--D-alanyl-D-alanine ligase [Candidatus Dependentiae bacterium]|nr:UDP-N-acetylmuramoyl-tripeptide--D-alanyl-D-alanine ligase [Candidatus Dependentiae bacterium]